MNIDIKITSKRRLWWILPFPDERSGVPVTCQFRPQKTIPFTRELQLYDFEVSRTGNDELDRRVWADARNSYNTTPAKIRSPKYNAITGEGDPNDLPPLELNIGIKSNVLSGVPVISDGTMGIVKGTPILKIDTLHPDRLPDPHSLPPWFKHHMIVIVNGKLNPFPQKGGRNGSPCFFAFISPIPLYIRMSELQEIIEMPNPYNPMWVWRD